jgi:hypothetical protein
MQKCIASDKGKRHQQTEISELDIKKVRLENRKQMLLAQKERLLNEIEDRKERETADRKSEIEFLDYDGKNMDAILKNLDKS